MTINEVLRLEALAADAAPGPWSVEGETYNEDGEPIPMPWGLSAPRGTLWSSGAGEYAHPDMATAAFIAESREAVPRLTEEIKALRLLLAEAHGALLVLLGPVPTPKGTAFLASIQAALTGDR
jgi:hypothetical protein